MTVSDAQCAVALHDFSHFIFTNEEKKNQCLAFCLFGIEYAIE